VACATTGVLVINPVIFAEVAVMIDSLEELNVLLPETLFRRDPLPWEAAFLAGRAFRRYKQAGGGKRRMLADFFIGAHGLWRVSRYYLEIEVTYTISILKCLILQVLSSAVG
jgi:predicted nucleic acid-binding protein